MAFICDTDYSIIHQILVDLSLIGKKMIYLLKLHRSTKEVKNLVEANNRIAAEKYFSTLLHLNLEKLH